MIQNRMLQIIMLFTCIISGEKVFSREQKDRVSVSVKEEKKEKQDIKKLAKPRSSHINLENTLEKKLINTIDSTVGFLENTRKGLPQKSPAYLEILFRMMTLRMEQAIYVQNHEFDHFEVDWEKWDQQGRPGHEPKFTSEKSMSLWKNVVKIGKEIIEKFPENIHGDKVLFNLASAFQYLNDDSRSIAAYSRLVEKYPKSSFVSDAHFSLGDYSFDRSDFHQAIIHYRENLKDTASSQYGWSLFKLGWAYYNLGQYPESIGFWKKAVAYSKTIDQKRGKRIRSEVFRDMPYAYAEIDQLQEAISFYKSEEGDKYLPNLYKTLANIFFGQGKFDRAIFLWKKLIQLNPLSPDAPQYQLEVISIEREKKNAEKVLAESIFLMKQFGAKSGWGKTNKDEDHTVYKKSLYYCKLLHKEAQESNNKIGYEHAYACYTAFIHVNDSDKRMAELLEYIGDIEYFLGKYDKAGGLYEKVASMDIEKASIYDEHEKKSGNNHERCASNMLDAYNKNFSDEFSQLVKRHVDEKSPEIPLSKAAATFLHGCSVYHKFYPTDKKSEKNCNLIESELYHRSAIREKAKKKLHEIAVKYSADKEGLIAAENLLPYYKSDKKKLLEMAYSLQKIPAYTGNAFGAKLHELIRATEVDVISSASPSVERGNLYEKRAKKYPKDPDADKYLFNAAADYFSYGKTAMAADIYVLILSKYPSSPVCEESLLQLGKMQDALLDFEKASISYQQYAEKYPDKKESAGAYKKACDLQMALDLPQATQTCKSFLVRYPKNEKAILHSLILAKSRAGKKAEAIALLTKDYVKYMTSNNDKIFYYHLIDQLQGSSAAPAMLLALPQKKEELDAESVLHYGEVLFKEALPIVEKITSFSLQGGTVEPLQAGIQQLTEMIGHAESAFSRVLALQDPYWGVAAFYSLTLCYEGFAAKLQNPPHIEGADPKEVKAQLQGSVDELLAKAKEYEKAGYETAEKFSVYNESAMHFLDRRAKREGKDPSQWWFDEPVFIGFYTDGTKIQNKIGASRSE